MATLTDQYNYNIRVMGCIYRWKLAISLSCYTHSIMVTIGELAGIIGVLFTVIGTIFGVHKYVDAKRIKVRVSIKNGFITYTNGGISEAMLILQVANIGQNIVIINTPAIYLKARQKKGNLITKFGYSSELPYELKSGDAMQAWCEIKPLAKSLKEQGITGKVKLKGYFSSQVGDEYSADREYRLDIDDWAKDVSGNAS